MTKYVWDGAVWKQVFDGGYFLQTDVGLKQVDYAWVWVDDAWRLYYTRAAAVTLTATVNSWEQITLNWSSVAVGATYVLKRDGAPVYSGPALTHPDTLLLPSKAYVYTIESYLSGTLSTTATANATTLAYGDLGLVATVTKYNNIALSWSAKKGSVNRFHLYDGDTPIYNNTGTSYNHAVGASTGHNYTLHAMRTDTSITTDTASATTGAVPRVDTWAYGSTTPNDAESGWTETTQRVLTGNNVQFVGGTNYLNHIRFRAAGKDVNARFEPFINGASLGTEFIKGPAPNTWQDFAGNSNCVWAAGVYSTQLKCGGVGGTTHRGCLGTGGGEYITQWGRAWWAAWNGQVWNYYVCTYGVYYWYLAYKKDFDDMAERFEWMTPELAAQLEDRNLQMFTWSEPDDAATITKVQIGDPETEELLLDWEAPGYTRKNLDQPIWAEWLQAKREGREHELRGNASGVRRPGN